MQNVDLTRSWPAQVSGYSMHSWKKHVQNLNLRVVGSLCLFLYITSPGLAICWRNWEDKRYDSMRWPWAVGESKRCYRLKCWTGSSIVYHRDPACGSTKGHFGQKSGSLVFFFQGFPTHPSWQNSGNFSGAPVGSAQRVSREAPLAPLGTTSSRLAWKLRSDWVACSTPGVAWSLRPPLKKGRFFGGSKIIWWRHSAQGCTKSYYSYKLSKFQMVF